MQTNCIKPDWPASRKVHAFTTTRSINLQTQSDRDKLFTDFNLPNEPVWLKQIHTNNVICADTAATGIQADAAYATIPNTICTVLTADCLPILVCDRLATTVAAIHAGWRSMVSGIIERTISSMRISGTDLFAWLGPAIGEQAFEVNDGVRDTYLMRYPKTSFAFTPLGEGKWLANLYALAKQILALCAINKVYGGEFCTYTDGQRFFSYRRDGDRAGRMASLIWFDK